jgi:hypothetical protein
MLSPPECPSFFIEKGIMKKLLVIMSLLCFISFSSVFAKPMFEPTKDQAFNSPLIAIVEYTGYKLEGKVDYFSGPIGKYKIIRLLKGANVPEVLDVRYDFSDGSACIAEAGWRFTEDLMPEKGSRWILFLDKDSQMKYRTTYRGSFGRWDASPENIQEVENVLKPQTVSR